ncbi:hypothetical protein [Streptomyces vilmorinianum]|uniref:hypothetical protein n=1 Tax=Streptomyces vilmorinianum TaxID=3051092 RepID=UPI0010FB5933|nr:hypothetical protein [Streptomyces vilmorinianum]
MARARGAVLGAVRVDGLRLEPHTWSGRVETALAARTPDTALTLLAQRRGQGPGVGSPRLDAAAAPGRGPAARALVADAALGRDAFLVLLDGDVTGQGDGHRPPWR